MREVAVKTSTKVASSKVGPTSDTCPTAALLDRLHGLRDQQEPLLALWQHTCQQFGAATALIHGEQHYSYAELAAWSSALAQRLLRGGVLPGDILALQGQRGVGCVVAQLAALKLACCYAPIDPQWPAAVQQQRLAQAQASVLLCCDDQAWAQPLNHPQALAVKAVQDDIAETKAAALPLPQAQQIPHQQPLYLLYTSGSSGVAKGVLGTRLGLWQRLLWQWRHLPYQAGGRSNCGSHTCERQAQRSRLSFVDAVAETWSALLAGVPLVIVDDQQVQDLQQLALIVAQQKITRLVLVPAMLQHLLDGDFGIEDTWQALRYCHVSGALMPKALWQRARQALPQCRWINLYGMTEAAADACAYLAPALTSADGNPAQEPATLHSVAIGNALPGQYCLLLSSDNTKENEQAKISVPESTATQDSLAKALFLTGDGLAQGYHQNPRATAESFLPACEATSDASAGEHVEPGVPMAPGQRMYNTGDWMYRHDHGLEFAGRRDQQVKVRGQRVELLALEHCVLNHPAVQECTALVVAKWDVLCLVLAVAKGAEITAATVRTFLHEHLAATMMPDLIDIRESLPHLWNGKLDRQAIAHSLIHAETQGTPPITATEQALALLWREVLRCSAPVRESLFLALGGNSLKAALLLARLREEWRVGISVRTFFALPTLQEQAEYLAGCLQRKTLAELAAKLEPDSANGDAGDDVDVVDF